MKNKQYSKEQKKAIENLVLDLDELTNKPRRLYYALEEFALAFEKDNSIPSIREAQEIMYRHIGEGDYYRELFNSLRQFKINEWEHQIKYSPEDISTTEDRIRGAENFIKTHIKELTDTRLY